MPRTIAPARRKHRLLELVGPTRKGNIKVTYEGWLECAKHALIREGVSAVKVDRLARQLQVTRGGFYHHFTNLRDLHDALVRKWRTENIFTPADFDASTPEGAFHALEALADMVMHERGFDAQFDMAIREWARTSDQVATIAAKVDAERIETIRSMFTGLGYESREAEIRARILYYHQIGYYALGIAEDVELRESLLPTYLGVLCGPLYLAAAKRR